MSEDPHIVARCPKCGEAVGQSGMCPRCGWQSPLDAAFARLKTVAEQNPRWRRRGRKYDGGQDKALPVGDR